MAGEQEISVEHMDDDDVMEYSSRSVGPKPTSVIVSVTADTGMADSDSDQHSSATQSPSHSPSLHMPLATDSAQRMLVASRLHAQVRQTLSEPGLKAKVQRQKQRLSPIPRRHALAKTSSVGASLDHSGTGVWKMVDLSASQRSPTSALDGGGEAREDSPPMVQAPSATALPGLTSAALQSASWLSAQGLIPSQEQLAKQQLDLIALIEQQKQMLQAAGSSGGEMFKFPVAAIYPVGVQPALPLQIPVTTNGTSATPSPVPSNASTDSGMGVAGVGVTGASADSLVIGGLKRPLSESQSAPGDTHYDSLMRQFQLQQQMLGGQQQNLYQQFLDSNQRLMQQAMLERKHLEEQQRQLASMHLRQQALLQQKQQQLLRQLQEQQLMQIQRHQMALLQQQQQQQQLAAASAQGHSAPPLRQFAAKSPLGSTTSSSSSASSGGTLDGGGGPGEMSSLGIELSPNRTPKALTPTNSLDSSNGRSSPNMGSVSPSGQEPVQGGTGLVYDSTMLKHNCSCGGSHPEHPGRLQSIWARLYETRVVLNCRRLRARKASLAELQSIHSENHVRLYGRTSQRKMGQEKKEPGRAFIQLSCGGLGVDQDTYWNELHTSNAARMAVGSVIELADKVVSGEVKNGFAFVRPPGHHALPNQAMGFCYFNNVALAAKAMLSRNKRVLLIDWDIHHGNGTQQIFYDNPSVLYLSIHRYDNGTFFPGTGRPEEIGSGAGLGFNVNLAFSGTQNFQGITAASSFGDAEYLAAFRSVVVPIAREFNPDITLVSAGFNATEGHPPTLGGYAITPACYSILTRMLMGVGNGRVALSLEGGYELMSLCSSAEACMRALLGLDLPQLDSLALERPPQPAAIASINKTIAYHKPYWSSLNRSEALVAVSHLEAERREREEVDTVSALASLSVAGGDIHHRTSPLGTVV